MKNEQINRKTMSKYSEFFSSLFDSHHRNDPCTEKARELDELFRSHAQTSQIQKFFNRNRQNLIPIFMEMIFPEALFDPDLIAKLEFHIVQAICNFLRQDTEIHASREMHYSSLILASDRIAPEKKALFWHILSDACPVGIGVLGNYYAKDVFMDNIQARYCFLFHRKTGKKRDFIKHTLSGRKGERYGFFGGRSDEMISYKPSDWILESVENDQVSVFEIERQIHGQNITVSMLLYLLNRHAVNCFLYLLKNYPKKVYKCRSPEEWLFTVCRHAREDTAIPIIRQIEFEIPGIVANTRDPWGNTLLWNTLKNHYIEVISK